MYVLCTYVFVIYVCVYECVCVCGPGMLSRYRDSLRAGRSGDRIQVGARIYAPGQTGPEAHPASCTMGTGSFSGVKRPRRGVDHPPPSTAEVKGSVQLHLYSPSGPSWPVLGWIIYIYIILGWTIYIILGRTIYIYIILGWTIYIYEVCSKSIRIGIEVVVHWEGCVCIQSWHVRTCLSNSWHTLQVAAFAQLAAVGRGSNACLYVIAIFTMCESTEQRICIKFCFKTGKPATETYRLLQQAYGEDAMGSTQVSEVPSI